MTAPVLTLDGETILADGVPILSLAADPEPVAVAIDAPGVSWVWSGDIDDLAWRITARINGAGLVGATALGLAGDILYQSGWEPDPATRAPFLREFDRLMQVAALWRRFIP